MSIALIMICALATAGNGEESLARLPSGRHCSWVPQNPRIEKSCDLLKVTADAKDETAVEIGGLAFPVYIASETFTVKFAYRSTAKAQLQFRVTTMEKAKCETWQTKPLEPSADWKTAALSFSSVRQDLYAGGLRFIVPAGAGAFEARDLVVAEDAPKRAGGKPFVVNGREIASIALKPNDDPMVHRSELRAARMFRYALYLNGGKYLPVLTVESAAAAPKNAFLVGLLAKEAGVVTAKPGLAGWSRAAKGGSLGLWGDAPTGNEFGMWRTLQDLGIEYLGSDWWYPTDDRKSFALAKDVEKSEKPSVPYRWIPYRAGVQCELRGQDNQFGAFADVGCGSEVHPNGLFWDSLGRIVTTKRFAKTHPEYFALRKDGTRRTDCKLGLEQFCWSNPELQKLVGERYCEMMDVAATAKFFVLAPGDGGDDYCRCENCRKMGTASERMLKFANAIAEVTARKHPDKYIFFYPYADTQEPPNPSLKAHPNVKIALTIYVGDYWPSCLQFKHPDNRLGFESLAGWRRIFPDAGYIGYYDQCNEWIRFWPNFHFVDELATDFGEHGALLAPRFGLIPTHVNGALPDCGGFASLRIYVTSIKEADCRADAVKAAHHYIDGCYGVAAADMKAFFDLSRQEPKRRNWVQGCEQTLFGLMDKDFSLKCLAHLDAAEAKARAAGDKGLLYRICKEKQCVLWSYLTDTCRGRGNVVGDDFAPWAKRLAEFCEVARVTGNAYIGNLQMDDWFNAVAFYKVTRLNNYTWTRAPEIDALIADPVKALGADFPNLQTKVEGGYEIASKGMMGGLMMRGSKWRSKTPVDMLVLRRESSTLGLVMTKLSLKKAPAADVRLVVTGIGSEKPNDFADMEILVNGKVAYKGKSAFGGEKHHDVTYTFPAKLFRAGENDISFKNVTVDKEAAFDGVGGANFRAKRDYNWGWYAIDKIRFTGVE